MPSKYCFFTGYFSLPGTLVCSIDPGSARSMGDNRSCESGFEIVPFYGCLATPSGLLGLDSIVWSRLRAGLGSSLKLNLYGTYRSAYEVLSISALSFGMIKQCAAADQIFQHWRNTGIRSSEYFARLRQALLGEHFHNDISCGDSGNKHRSHRGLEEVGQSLEISESDPSESNFLLRNEVDQDASIGSGQASISSFQSNILRQNVSDAATQ